MKWKIGCEEEKKIFVSVKAMPHISKKYGETVCTGGIMDGKWVRLYPIPYRLLKGDQKFDNRTWIRAKVQKNESDSRPDSYLIYPNSIEVIEKIEKNPKNNTRLWDIYKNTIHPSLEAFVDDAKNNVVSLGAILGKEFIDLIIEQNPNYMKYKEFIETMGNDLFMETIEGEPIARIPEHQYKLKLHFRCYRDKCNAHKLSIVAWNILGTSFFWKNHYKNETILKQKIREKMGTYFGNYKTTLIFVGTHFIWKTPMIGDILQFPSNITNQNSLF